MVISLVHFNNLDNLYSHLKELKGIMHTRKNYICKFEKSIEEENYVLKTKIIKIWPN